MKWNPASDPVLCALPEVAGHRVLGDCLIYSLLGRGGMGSVFKAVHLKLEADVAVKCMRTDLGSGSAAQAGMRERFLREARFGAAITHQNLVAVKEVGSAYGIDYFVLEFVRGENAWERLARKKALSVAEAVGIIRFAALGLAEVHRRTDDTGAPCVHRDVKPANIMVDAAGRVKLLDLGLVKSRRREAGHTSLGSAFGTPEYMPPEQFVNAGEVGPTADVWSLGVSLYALLAGRHPYSGTPEEIQKSITRGPFPDVRTRREDVSLALAAVIARCTQFDPGDRYLDAAALVDALRSFDGAGESELADAEAGRRAAVPEAARPSEQSIAEVRAAIAASEDALFPSTRTASGDDKAVPTTRRPASTMSIRPRMAGAIGLLLLVLAATGGVLRAAWGKPSESDPRHSSIESPTSRPAGVDSPAPSEDRRSAPPIAKRERPVAFEELCTVEVASRARGSATSRAESAPTRMTVILVGAEPSTTFSERVSVRVKRLHPGVTLNVTRQGSASPLAEQIDGEVAVFEADLKIGENEVMVAAERDDDSTVLKTSKRISLLRERERVAMDQMARLVFREPGKTSVYGSGSKSTTSDALEVRLEPIEGGAPLVRAACRIDSAEVSLVRSVDGSFSGRVPLTAVGTFVLTFEAATAVEVASDNVEVARLAPPRAPEAPRLRGDVRAIFTNHDRCEARLEGPSASAVLKLKVRRGNESDWSVLTEPFDAEAIRISIVVAGGAPRDLVIGAPAVVCALTKPGEGEDGPRELVVTARWNGGDLEPFRTSIVLKRDPPKIDVATSLRIRWDEAALSMLEGASRTIADVAVPSGCEIRFSAGSPFNSKQTVGGNVELVGPVPVAGETLAFDLVDAAGNRTSVAHPVDPAECCRQSGLPRFQDKTRGRILVLPFANLTPSRRAPEPRAFASVFNPNKIEGTYEVDRISSATRTATTQRLRELIAELDFIAQDDVDSVLGVVGAKPGSINRQALRGDFDSAVAARLARMVGARGWVQGAIEIESDGSAQATNFRPSCRLSLTLFVLEADGFARRGQVELSALGNAPNHLGRDIVSAVRPQAVAEAVRCMLAPRNSFDRDMLLKGFAPIAETPFVGSISALAPR